jgi:AcrR family transcriptional regulator
LEGGDDQRLYRTRPVTAAAGDGRRLPPGAHGIPPELVARNQRERLVAAIAEACAERGFAEIAVTDVTRRAGVSNATFYEQFADKQSGLLAAHRELFGRLLEEVDRACAAAASAGEKVRGGIRTALSLLAEDPPTARLLTVEIVAAGAAGTELQAAAFEVLASRLRTARGAGEAPGRPNADWAMVASMSALVARLVMAGEAARLPELEDELVAMALDRFAPDE